MPSTIQITHKQSKQLFELLKSVEPMIDPLLKRPLKELKYHLGNSILTTDSYTITIQVED
jgi:hypothetical protein